MTYITTTCVKCGEVEVPVARLVLRVGSVEDAGECVARCPRCTALLHRAVNAAMAAMLITVGVHVSRWGPVDVDRFDAAPFTHDDVVAFADALAGAAPPFDEMMFW